jgi:tetratricopeptide (TPR) repeat protein
MRQPLKTEDREVEAVSEQGDHMLQLSLDSAPYTELDFPKFNSEGFRRIQQAVEMAQQQKALAQTAEDLQRATHSLRDIAERKSLEQRIAQKNFESQRRQTFEALQGLHQSFRSARLQGARRLEVETRLDHLTTLFHLKDFDAVTRQIPGVRSMLLGKTLRSMSAPAPSSYNGSAGQAQSATALFLRAQQLERAGDIRKAVEVYGQVLERNPRHFQAIHRLNRISGQARKATW